MKLSTLQAIIREAAEEAGCLPEDTAAMLLAVERAKRVGVRTFKNCPVALAGLAGVDCERMMSFATAFDSAMIGRPELLTEDEIVVFDLTIPRLYVEVER